MHQVAPCGLEIAFRQLGFDEQLSQLQVHLTSILRAVLQRDSRSEAKGRMKSRLDPEQGTDSRAAQDSRVTENVHEQRVGAVGAFELAPRAICLSGKEARAGVDLGQPRFPAGLLQNSLVRGRQGSCRVPRLHLLT